VTDLVLTFAAIAFFALSLALVAGCDRIVRS